MFVNNGSQLKNYGIELQNIGTQIQNFGMQMKNTTFTIGDQLENLGMQISNLGIQVFTIGTNISNMMLQNQNMGNISFQNQFMGLQMFNYMNQNNNMGIMNQMQSMENNNKESNNKKTNFIFETHTYDKITVIADINDTIEEVIKLFMKKIGLTYNEIKEKKNIYFLYSGNTIDMHDKSLFKDFIIDFRVAQTIIAMNI